ncbi:MAG: CsbD family protein [Anaerolineales bacterium]|nr:CsbD family protein [Anaerolineales bacterium]
MKKDVFERKWNQIRGESKVWWGKLTDDDLDQVGGKLDVLAGLLQKRYSFTHQRAIKEIEEHLTEYDASMDRKTEPSPGR